MSEPIMDYQKTMKTLQKITDGETLLDEDWIVMAHLVSYLRSMNPINVFIEEMGGMETSKSDCELETISASKLSEIDFQAPSAEELHERLRACESNVTEYGEWKYDRVPSDLVQDLLFFLETLKQ